MLRFQAEARVFFIKPAAFAAQPAIEKITAVELNAGLRRIDAHAAPA